MRVGALDEPLVLDHVEDGERRRLRDRVADVGAADRRVAGRVHDLRLAEDAGERQPGGDRLGDGDQVGLDAVVLDREHRPVRPKPVCTSSTTRTIPCRSQIARTPSTNSRGARMKPPSP